jgi:predicted amidohydrolase YtcJ
VSRMGKLSVTASMQPAFCCFNDPPASPSNVWQSLEQSGANVAFGSDWPCSWPPDPLSGIQQAVQREVRRLFTAPVPAVAPTFTSPEQRLTVEQAVAAYTRAGAYARFSENRIGTLESGKEADLAVLSKDIFSVPPEQIGKTHVVITMVGGTTVFDESKQKAVKSR